MEDREFALVPSRLAPALIAGCYAFALYILFTALYGYWRLGFCSAWLLLLALDLRRFGFYPSLSPAPLRYHDLHWQLCLDGTWSATHCSLYFRTPLYLQLEWQNLPKPRRWQFIWRDSLSTDDWHALNVYLDVAGEHD